MIITGSGSILVLTSADSFDNPDFVTALREKGIDKFMAFEIPEETVRSRYGQHFAVTMADMKQFDILRIVDVDGQRIFRNFDLERLGNPVLYDRPREVRRAA